MEKKGDLLLNVSELRSLRKKIEEVYSEIHPADLQKLWRSNPDSYGILKDLIKERTGKDLSTRFLSRSLHLSIHSGNYASFRESNMDALYQFAYGDIRSKVFQSLINDHRNQTLYYLGNESEINAAVRKSLSLDFATIERNTEKISSLLVKAINEDDQVVRIYINKEYLESTVGIQDLIEVLSQNLQRSFFDTNIKFHFDKDLFKEKGLLTSEGFGTLEKYWAAKLASVESDHKKTYPDLVENEVKEYRLIESNLKRVCIALKQIHYQDPGPLQKTDEFSIEHFSPYLKTNQII